MDQVQAMFFLADAWLKVKPETIKNCWRHTRILEFKENTFSNQEITYPTIAWPLDKEISAELNAMLPSLPGNDGNQVTDIAELDLEADEDELVLTSHQIELENNDEEREKIPEEEIDADATEEIDINECKKRLREAYETILIYEVPQDDLDRQFHKRVRTRLAQSRADSIASREQTDLRSYFFD
jgi:hypothetical protein